jgi:hypothetical protein
VVPLDIADLVHGQIASKWYGEVISERQDLSTLISKIINQLGVLTILPSQHFLPINTQPILTIFLQVTSPQNVPSFMINSFVKQKTKQKNKTKKNPLFGEVIANFCG